MKEVVNVSIGGVALTIEKEAYKEIGLYLSELKKYYSNEAGSDEIIEDIEERIAELICEKGGKDRIVTLAEVNIIIEILGRPYVSDLNQTQNSDVKKRLYRDTENAVIGGVCSGFGAYTGIDSVIVRIGYILLFVLLSTPIFMFKRVIGLGGMSTFTFAALVYCILWVIIPAAKTVAQRCAMKGVSTGVDEIKNKMRDSVNGLGREFESVKKRSTTQKVGSAIGRAFSIIIGIILFGISISGLITGCIMFAGFSFFDGISVFGILDYVNVNFNMSILKILGIVCYFLPFIGILYASIRLMFGFKSPKWKPGLIIFIIWIVSLLSFTAISAIAAKPYYNSEELRESITLNRDYDTLYLNYKPIPTGVNAKMYAKAEAKDLSLMYLKKIENGYEYIVYPKLRIYRDTTISEPRIDYKHEFYTGISAFSENELMLTKDNVINVKDSLVSVFPVYYSKANKY